MPTKITKADQASEWEFIRDLRQLMQKHDVKIENLDISCDTLAAFKTTGILVPINEDLNPKKGSKD